MRIMLEENGLLCVSTFVSCNIEGENSKWVIMRLMSGQLYRIEFDGEDVANAFVKQAYIEGKVNLYEYENHIVREGMVEPKVN